MNQLDDILYPERVNLVSAWSRDEAISLRKRKLLEKPLYLFGAGEYIQLIRCFLPDLYNHAKGLIVSNKRGVRLFDKPLYLPDEIVDKSDTRIILGVKKISRSPIREQLIEAKFLKENIFDFEYI